MGCAVNPIMGTLIIKDFYTGEIVAIGTLQDVKIVEISDMLNQYQLIVKDFENIGSLKELAGEKITDSTGIEDKD